MRWFHPMWVMVVVLVLESAFYLHAFRGGACPYSILSRGTWRDWHIEGLQHGFMEMLGLLLTARFWGCYASYLLLAVIAPVFMTICMDVETPKYSYFTFALGRGILLYTFSSSTGLSFALGPVCGDLATLINFLLATTCYFGVRFGTQETAHIKTGVQTTHSDNPTEAAEKKTD